MCAGRLGGRADVHLWAQASAGAERAGLRHGLGWVGGSRCGSRCEKGGGHLGGGMCVVCMQGATGGCEATPRTPGGGQESNIVSKLCCVTHGHAT